EFLPDSDHLFGATNVKGSEFEFALGLADRVNVSVDYYSHAEFLGTDIAQDLLQIDLNLKW
ncbi:MAG: putative porin, partial [Pseudomonadales bacterium]